MVSAITAPDWGPGTQRFRLEAVADPPYRFGRRNFSIDALVLAHWRAGQPIVDSYNLVSYLGQNPLVV